MATAVLTGTAIVDGVNETDIVTGSETIIITLTGDTWVATIGDDNAFTTALIAGIDSDGSETAGWDAQVKGNMVHGDITRTSSTIVTVILAVEASYAIVQNETITVTIPTTALTAAVEIIATPTFDVSVEQGQGTVGTVEYGDALLAELQADGATGKEVVSALNQLNGTIGVEFDEAYRTYTNT